MASHELLNCYAFFSTAATAYRVSTPEMRARPDTNACSEAFNAATNEMNKSQQADLIKFIESLTGSLGESQEIDQPKSTPRQFGNESVITFRTQFAGDIETLSTEEFLGRSGITREELKKKLCSGRIFKIPECLHQRCGENYYPAFFADSHFDAELIETVSQVLNGVGDRKFWFFLKPLHSCGYKAPLAALARGQFGSVLAAANSYRNFPWAQFPESVNVIKYADM